MRFILAVMRNMVTYVSSDVIHLSVIPAAREFGISEERALEILGMLLRTQKASGAWPEGFMG